MSDEPRNLTAARLYAAKGWACFPLRPKSKTPLTQHGFHDATTDIDLISRMWTSVPAAGVGIATGKVSGILVLDVDPRNGGTESLAILEAQYGALPATVECLTGGGGRHLYFKCPPGGAASGNGWPGLDVKGDGGYVVAPFSTHPTGPAYYWAKGCDPDDLPLADPPSWLLTPQEGGEAHPPKKVEQEIGVIPEGKRNESLTSLAGTMRRRGMAYTSILKALQDANVVSTTVPLPVEEVEAIARSVMRYAPDPESSPFEKPSANRPRSLLLEDIHQLATTDPPPVAWILDGRLARGDCALLVGPPKTGKSWITMEIAIAGALGLPILGHFPTPRLKVLLVDEENIKEEVWRRVRALINAHEADHSALRECLTIAKTCQGFSFRDETYVVALKELIERIQPDIVILDSLTALSDIKDENKAADVRRFFHDRLYPLRAICGSTFLCVHHTNKSVYQTERPTQGAGIVRGSIDLIAAPECCFLVEKNPSGDEIKLESVVRRGMTPPDLYIRIVDGQRGGVRPIVVSVEDPPSSSKSDRIPFVVEDLLKNGEPWDISDIVPKVQAVIRDTNERTVRKAIALMYENGVLEKCGQNPSGGGRPSTLYRLT